MEMTKNTDEVTILRGENKKLKKENRELKEENRCIKKQLESIEDYSNILSLIS